VLAALLLLVVQADWTVTSRPLLEAPWVGTDAEQGPEHTLLAQGSLPDGGTGVFAVMPGQSPVLLSRELGRLAGPAFVRELSKDGGEDVSALATTPQPRLVPLGTFSSPGTARCIASGSLCAVATQNEVWLVTGAQREKLLASGEDDVSDFGAARLSFRSDGKWLAVERATDLWLFELSAPNVVYVSALTSFSSKNAEAVNKKFDQWKQRQPDARVTAAWGCSPGVTQWQDGDDVDVELGDSITGVGDPGCELKSRTFTLSLRTLKRTPLPAYPWVTNACPEGGWLQPLGKVVMKCDSARAAPRKKGREQPEDPSLPEALALNDNTIFVRAPAGDTALTYWPKATQKPIPLLLKGPSVLTYGPKSIVLQPIDFPDGIELGVPLDDDWHLSAATGGSVLYRFEH